jgi:glyoxylase-like metal-dependent hydrolase (beta-lactamase superfamily II)
MHYEIKLLDLGEVELDGSRTVITRSPGTLVRVPVYAFLILGGPDAVLVDTGFRHPSILQRLGMRAFESEEQKLENRLAEHGLRPHDIRYILQTHLHIDHAGQTDKFPMATTVVTNRRELEYAVSGLSGASYPPEDIKHMIDRLHTKSALRLLDLELTGREEVLPGIYCTASGAHTEGSMMVYLETAAGVACICGDALYNVEEQVMAEAGTLSGDPLTSNNFVVSRRAEKAAIKRILGSAPIVCPSHDRPAIVAHGRVMGRLGDQVPSRG